ncbi:hypothetical protein HAT2_00082 [Candidatus Similichlamydia laticola]|uniref:Uncharacterized protein n=1 Tax=Candidatus Similichlamydia laticola TaxID=2170265 RepID=A0A369KB21_9BACT|nr:hypothetical protein HAT2_00082 [Candidatus Similichlamydia laticola]
MSWGSCCTFRHSRRTYINQMIFLHFFCKIILECSKHLFG